MPTRWRHWPAMLAMLAIVFFFLSYLFYTHRLTQQIRAESQIYGRVYGLVLRGLISPSQAAAARALLDVQAQLMSVGYGIVVLDADGVPLAAQHVPFDTDSLATSEAQQRRVVSYATRVLARANPPIVEPGLYTVYYAAPPILSRLRWIPWLQAGGALVLLLVTFALLRVHVRAERERTWASLARELAHQMGTPLSSLAGWVEMLQLPAKERASLANPERIASEIGADVERLERVSRRFEMVGKPAKLEPVNVDDVLAELESYIRPRLPRLGSGVELRARKNAGVRPVAANRVLLLWALENLVKNAMDALAGRGGRILLTARNESDGRVLIRVADNGPGVSQSVRDSLFDPGVSTKSSGWGVGLSLTRRIVEDYHRGRISVHARRRAGTVFEIHLPAAR